MSTDGNGNGGGVNGGGGNGSVVDDGNASVISNSQNTLDDEIIKNQAPQTPRFTLEEKQILYALFHEHEEVIDIKFRKKSRNKYSVRDAWDQIVHDFNTHPSANAIRSCKQIQKFWLNSRYE